MSPSRPHSLYLPLRWALLCLALIAVSPGATATVTVVRYPQQEVNPDIGSNYFLALLELVLRKTEASDGPYRLQVADVSMQQGRALESLVGTRRVDVVWTVTSREREQHLLPVRIPLEKGLFGYRVLLIRTGEQGRFDRIKTLTDLAGFSAGQGHDWPDTAILRANQLPVETSSNYPNLFVMLARGRFDYFPRSVSEVSGELRQHQQRGLVLEQRLLLHYPSAMYFFVAKENTALAQRLEKGLYRALNDGSFDALFQHHPAMQDALKLLQQPNRVVLQLNNPLLPEQTPLAVPLFWLEHGRKPR